MFSAGDRVWVPTLGGTWTEATFVAAGEPKDALAVPSPHGEGGFVMRDVGWVRFEDGKTERYALPQIRPRPPA